MEQITTRESGVEPSPSRSEGEDDRPAIVTRRSLRLYDPFTVERDLARLIALVMLALLIGIAAFR